MGLDAGSALETLVDAECGVCYLGRLELGDKPRLTMKKSFGQLLAMAKRTRVLGQTSFVCVVWWSPSLGRGIKRTNAEVVLVLWPGRQ